MKRALAVLMLFGCADGSAPLSQRVKGGQAEAPPPMPPGEDRATKVGKASGAKTNFRGGDIAGELADEEKPRDRSGVVDAPGDDLLAGLSGHAAPAPEPVATPRAVPRSVKPMPMKPRPKPKPPAKGRRLSASGKKGKLKIDSAPMGGTVTALLPEASAAELARSQGSLDLMDGLDDDGDMVIEGRIKKPASKVIKLEELAIEGTEEGEGFRQGQSGEFAYKDAFGNGRDSGLLLSGDAEEADEERGVRPDSFLPRMCYFENTYLGGNAAHAEHLRRLDADFGSGQRPYREARLPPQAFDPPMGGGLALTAQLDRRWVDKPGRVVLQVGLQGSERYGWRRPPIDVALVVDQPVMVSDEAVVVDAVTGLVRRLGPQDRLAVVLVGPRPQVLAPLGPVRDVRKHLAKALDAMKTPPAVGPAGLAAAMTHAGDLLAAGTENSARVPGAQTVLLLTAGGGGREQAAQVAAHDNNLRGLQNSVIDVSKEQRNDWWSVANAGYGNFHQADPQDVLKAIDAELESLSRVIARLLRLNVRLAPNVEAIRVIGSRVLGQTEVKQVKDREEAQDQQLSKVLGVKSNRGDDDDGIQTVIPYFYGGDAHVVLIELWVEKPGPVADITLKFKDMVTLANSTAQANAHLSALPRAETPAERAVKRNVKGFEFASALGDASELARRGEFAQAREALGRRPAMSASDARVAARFDSLLANRNGPRVADALALAKARRVGYPP